MANPRSALVIGGGIVGLNVALSLIERGLAVTLLDDAPARPPASWGNAGHVAIEQTDPLASVAALKSLPRRLYAVGGPVSFPPNAVDVWLPFGLRLLQASLPARFAGGRRALTGLLGRAIPAWRTRLAKLGRPDFLKETGHFVVWETETLARAGREAKGNATAGFSCREATRDERDRLAAMVKVPIAGAMRFEGTAHVADPGLVLAALRQGLIEAGGTIETGTATPQRLARPDTDLVVVAAGVGSAPLIASLGHRVPLVAERGYHIQSAGAQWPDDLPPLVFEDRSVVVTRFTGGLRATSFVEFTRPDAAPDARKWDRLRRHADALGLPFGAETTTWHGSRPTLPDYLPAIGRSRRAPHLLYAFGHQHLGLTLGPVSGEIIAALALGETASVDIAPFDLDRF